jgi:hypothetical protein
MECWIIGCRVHSLVLVVLVDHCELCSYKTCGVVLRGIECIDHHARATVREMDITNMKFDSNSFSDGRKVKVGR